MTLGHGPKIITNGLVFAYDMGPNPGANKSWKGAPTFNASLQNGQNDVSPWSGDGTPTSLGIDSSVKFRGRKVAKYQTGSSGNCYINGAGDLSTGTTSTVWTSTIYLKRVDNTPLTSVTMYQYITNNTNVNAAQTLTLVEDGWYKAVYTRSGLSAGYPSLTGMTGLGAGNQYYFADWQCENNLYSTPWVSGTRSNTQALLDLTGNNTVTASSLTYNSDGSFSFNGTSNYMTVGSSSDWAFGGNGTIEQWVYPTNSTGNDRLWCVNNNSSSIDAYLNGSSYNLYYHGNTSNGGTLTQNAWNHVCVTYTSGVIQSYVNCVAASMGGTTTGYNITNSSQLIIGEYQNLGGYNIYGKIPVMKIYNKSLTAPEVTQNFNALRGRYGI